MGSTDVYMFLCSLEIFDSLPEVDAVFVPVGGGGLIGGIATYLKEANPSIKVSDENII